MAAKRYLMIRGVALVLLLMVVYIAWIRNFGEGVKGVPLLALLSAALSFALEWIDHSQSERAKKYLTHTMLSLPLGKTGHACPCERRFVLQRKRWCWTNFMAISRTNTSWRGLIGRDHS